MSKLNKSQKLAQYNKWNRGRKEGFYSGRDQGMVDKKIYLDYFKDIKIENGVCMECGALDGETLSICRFFEYELGWDCYNIEANPESFEILVQKRPNATNLNYALSKSDGAILEVECLKLAKLARVGKHRKGMRFAKIETITIKQL